MRRLFADDRTGIQIFKPGKAFQEEIMPRIRCRYMDCIFLEENFCGAAAIELDPDAGCLTYSQTEKTEPEEDWEEDKSDEDWEDEEEGFELDEEEEDEGFEEEET
jgi:hypothetical protein